jgi:hypothetical protein
MLLKTGSDSFSHEKASLYNCHRRVDTTGD